MNYVKFIDKTAQKQFVNHRSQIDNFKEREDASVVYAEKITFLNSYADLVSCQEKYVLLGIPEDIGVRANFGRVGASEAWDSFLPIFLSTQINKYRSVDNIAVLGTIKTEDQMDVCEGLYSYHPDDRLILSKCVQEIDKRVEQVISQIVQLGKIPIVIGGGHNNAYPLLKATAVDHAIDVVNIDAHTDLRPAIGRHSGNGFSHALKDGAIGRYHAIGLQPSALTTQMQELIDHDLRISADFITDRIDFTQRVEQVFDKIKLEHFALEIDMDVVKDFPSSAQSPVGFSFQELIDIVTEIVKKGQPRYIHICEAAPVYGYKNQVGKALSYLVNTLINI